MSVRAKMFLVLGLGLIPIVGTFGFVQGGGTRFGVIVTIFIGMAALIPWAASADQRPPFLTVEYRNPSRGDAAVVDREAHDLRVVVVNRGKGPAEAVEVTFDNVGARIWNESGNNPDYTTLDPTVVPPRFLGKDRVLNPGEEWAMALLSWYHGPPHKAEFAWEARARGMERRAGTAKIEIVPGWRAET
jgi:hypothetical protein